MSNDIIPEEPGHPPAHLGRQGIDKVARHVARLRGLLQLYTASESDAARFRARQLQAVLRLTPVAMAINVLNAVVICAVLWPQAPRKFLLSWALVVVLLAVLGFRGWFHSLRKGPRATASPRTLRRAAVQASVLGLTWAVLPFWVFNDLDADAQFFLGMVVTGMMCAGGFALSTVPLAGTSYVLMLGAGAALALWQSASPLASSTTILLLAYSVIVVYSVWNQARTLGARLVAEARADRQHEVIGLLLRDFEDHASDLLWELDARGSFAHVSSRLLAALNTSSTALQHVRAPALLRRRVPRGPDGRAHWAALALVFAGGAAFRDQVVVLQGPAGPRWWSLSARPLTDEQGRHGGWRGVAADITDRQLAHRRLSWLAHNDALTGLVNRTQFRELLQALLTAPMVVPLAVVSIDLDGFKQLNDSRGHAAGDQFLQAFGERLLSVARRSDIVARLGGDEFAMLVRGASDTREVNALLDRLLLTLNAPCQALGHAAPLRASMGVALAPADGGDVDTLMSHADIALYAAKHEGGHRYRFFQPAMAERGRRRTALEEGLRHAARRGEFCLEFQPQVATSNGSVTGFEALLRWRHPALGQVPPAEFIPIAEAAGLMPSIGDWVLADACRQAAGWPPSMKVSINVSATQLGQAGFVERVQALSRGLSPGRVELEITESVLIDDTDAAITTLAALRAQGFRIALDDFGTGYSALGYLRRFPFDTLKIDRSFVHDLALDGEAQIIIDTILAMSRALHMMTIAEGVETEAEATMLRQRGCGALQGYLISRPLPAAAVPAFLRDWAERQQRVAREADAFER
jgi:diguanylate cyclase (GGDEF)-like protein